MKKISISSFIVLLTALLLQGAAFAQTTTVRGVIKDVVTGETLPYVTVTVPGTTIGNSADDDGRYVIKFTGAHQKLRFNFIGYVPVEVDVVPGKDQIIDIQMDVNQDMLDAVVVEGKRGRYRNRDNPAVQLIRKVIEHKEENQMFAYDYVQYKQYEKISFALSNLSEKFKNRKIFKNYQFLFKEQDSTEMGGRIMLPAYMEEKLSDVYYRGNPEKKKQYILANKKAEFDPRFIDNDGLSSYFNRLYEDINIYDNDISIATNLLLSPIANTAPTFYKFFITDTIKTNDPWLVELSFIPRNKSDLLFEGKIYITLDGNYAVQNAYLTVNNDINLNFMRDLEARLEFEKHADGRYFLSKSTLGMEFAITEKGGGMYGQRVVDFDDYRFNEPQADSIYNGPSEVIAYNVEEPKPESYWDEIRPLPLAQAEVEIYRNVDTLQKIPSFRRFMDISTLVLAGYKNFGKVEMGPANTFYSFNPVEGFRLRLGGRTTPEFSKRFYAETYVAYGFKDEKWKYFLSGTYSFNNKSIYKFPGNYLRASFQRDTKIPGQDLQFVQEDNFLLSFKRGDNHRWLYNDIYRLQYVREFENHFSYSAGLTKWKQTPAGILRYQYDNYNDNIVDVNHLNTTELNVQLRYAPNEQYYQGKLYRTPIFNKYPIFTLNYNMGIKDFLDGEYNYHNLNGSIFKRVYLSQFGYADVTAEGGYILGKNIPFPLLSIHRANQTYAYQLNSYNLMNFMEFVSDQYAAINVQYYMNGFLFNKIPLIKKLKLREVFSIKSLWGDLRDENNPAMTNNVFRFPVDPSGNPISYTLNSGPYVEGSVGIANIFKLLRVDLVKRFTYLDNPEVAEWGIRARFKLDF
jgi:hypothetical protein